MTSPQLSSFFSFLEREGVLTPQSSQRAATACRESTHPFDIVITELGLLRENELVDWLARFLGLTTLPNLPVDISPNALSGMPFALLQQKGILPLHITDNEVTIAVADPFAVSTLEAMEFYYERPILLRILPRRLILDRLKLIANPIESTADPADEQRGINASQEDIDRLRDIAREAPVVKFVAETIHRAVDRLATDIHIEPQEDHIQIRLRRDGVLDVNETAPLSMLGGISTRIKILSRLNIAERRLPQDGRMRIAVRGRDVDLRVSIVPALYGETIVLRILGHSGVEMRLDRLGFDGHAQELIRKASIQTNGIILVTGPTGSGKTTTLYSIISQLSDSKIKIFTIEDPIEYRLKGITQLQINPQIKLDFAAALRSILRQDPDVILVGEIRDRETAQIAIQAALTGHLVLSTLHTNSAAGALTRLRDMGIDGYLLSSTIRAVVAQRLLRRCCLNCAEQPSSDRTSCSVCMGSGYSGRTVTYETMVVTKRIAEMINVAANEAAIEDVAHSEGMVPLRQHAGALVGRGITTREEVLRVIDLDGTA